jgi:hypothetical protein
MNVMIAIIAVAFLAFGSNATAQEKSSRTASHEAPIGHRQPTAKDVEGSQSTEGVGSSPQLDRLDKELDQKLTGRICRGC